MKTILIPVDFSSHATHTTHNLPDPGKEETYGRMNKGIAGGLLAKYYLNTKQ